MKLLSVESVGKSFPGVRALDDVSFEVRAGEVHALLGENGAGKSTLLKILSGAHPADAGIIRFGQAPLDPRDSPRGRQALGIVTIYQEFNLAPNLSVAENLYLGRERMRGGWIDWKGMRTDAQAVLAKLGGGVAADAIVRNLSVAEQQLVEIARALTLEARLIIMDEPTAALSAREVRRLHEIIAGLKQDGVGVVYVTHRLDEVKAICDRYTVLRDGRVAGGGDVHRAEISDFVRAMVGRDLAPPPARVRKRGETVLETHLDGQALTLHAGEIVGMAGLVGAGRTAFARAICGAERTAGAAVVRDGRMRTFASPTEAVRSGIVMVPEDRKAQGCFLTHPLLWNSACPALRSSRGQASSITVRSVRWRRT